MKGGKLIEFCFPWDFLRGVTEVMIFKNCSTLDSVPQQHYPNSEVPPPRGCNAFSVDSQKWADVKEAELPLILTSYNKLQTYM
jgi:hypothetical protein